MTIPDIGLNTAIFGTLVFGIGYFLLKYWVALKR